MNKLLIIFFLIVVGCATIITGPNQKIAFNSTPQGAKITINGSYVGKTPITIPIKRKNDIHVINFSKSGYNTKQMMLKNHLNKWIAGDIFFLVGFAVDLYTGAFWELEPNKFFVTLESASVK